MARYVKPLSDFDKMFEIYFNNKNEIKEFEDNGEIFEHKPFQDYISNFDDSFIYFDRHKLIADKDLEDIQIITYANGHKIDLDLCSAFSNRAALYCLETKEVFYINVN